MGSDGCWSDLIVGRQMLEMHITSWDARILSGADVQEETSWSFVDILDLWSGTVLRDHIPLMKLGNLPFKRTWLTIANSLTFLNTVRICSHVMTSFVNMLSFHNHRFGGNLRQPLKRMRLHEPGAKLSWFVRSCVMYKCKTICIDKLEQQAVR